jgi:hypothetical protein
MWTLIPLEAMGKLDNFSVVFDIDTYKKNASHWKKMFRARKGTDSMETSIMDYAKEKGMSVPNVGFSRVYRFGYRAVRKIKKTLKKG